MRIKMRQLLILLALTFSTLVIFQNCGAPIEETADVSGVAANLPFAYDTVVDHLAYMSCSTVASGSNPDNFFTFKAGAFDPGSGMKLRDDFNYEARNLTQSVRADALSESPANKDAYLQIGVRRNGDFQQLLNINRLSYGDYVGALTTGNISSALVSLFNSNRITTLGGAPILDSMSFFRSEVDSQSLRNDLATGQAVLSVAYSKTGRQPNVALGPSANSATSIYGRGFVMGFRLGHGVNGAGSLTNFSSGSARIMQNVNEYNLENGNLERGWVCPAEWTFMIVRNPDAVGTLCTGHASPAPPTLAQEPMYQALRRVLPSGWGYNLNQRCIVPTVATDNCYGGATTINYAGPACDPNLNNCPHYVTICKRQ